MVSAGFGAEKALCCGFGGFLARNGLCVVISAKSWRGRGFVRWIRAREQEFGSVLARKGLRAVDFGRLHPVSGAQALLCGENPLLDGRFSPHGACSAPKRPLFLAQPLFWVPARSFDARFSRGGLLFDMRQAVAPLSRTG